MSGGGPDSAGGVVSGVVRGVPNGVQSAGGVADGGECSLTGERRAGTPCLRSRCVRKKYLLQYSLQHISQNASGLTTPSRRSASGWKPDSLARRAESGDRRRGVPPDSSSEERRGGEGCAGGGGAGCGSPPS